MEQSIGMCTELVVRLGQLFFARCSGITDPAQLEGDMEVTDHDEIYREVLQNADIFYEEVFERAVW